MVYFIRSGALFGYPELVRELGADPITLITDLTLDPRLQYDYDYLLSYRAVCELLQRTAAQTGYRDFGLRLADRQHISILGALGALLTQCPDIRSAIDQVTRHIHLHNQAERWAFIEKGESVQCIRHDLYPGELINTQMREMSIADATKLLRGLCGNDFRPLSVHFTHAPVSPPRDYFRHFKCDVLFNQEFDGVLFDQKFLGREISGADEGLRQALDQYLEYLELHFADDFAGRIRVVIQQAMSAPDCNVEGIARLLAVSKRTLQRRLEENNLNFRSLLAEIRGDTACRYLANSRLPLTQLAGLLGYTELSTFSRAFKSRYGETPARWRKLNRPA